MSFWTQGWQRGIPQAIEGWGQMAKAKGENAQYKPLLADLIKEIGTDLDPDTSAVIAKMPAKQAFNTILQYSEIKNKVKQARQDREMQAARDKAMADLTSNVIGGYSQAPPTPPPVPLSPTGDMGTPPPLTPENLPIPGIMKPNMRPPNMAEMQARMPSLLKFLTPEQAYAALSKTTDPATVEHITPGTGRLNPITKQWEVPIPATESTKQNLHYYTHRDNQGMEYPMAFNEDTGQSSPLGDPSFPVEKKGNFWYYSELDPKGMEQHYQYNEDTGTTKKIGKPSSPKPTAAGKPMPPELTQDLQRASQALSAKNVKGKPLLEPDEIYRRLTAKWGKEYYSMISKYVYPGKSPGTE